VSGGTGTAGVTATPTSGTVQPGGSQAVTVRFTPTIPQLYSGTINVVGDQTSGSNIVNFLGQGINNAPLFTRSGSGANVFDMPTSVRRVRIFGDYGGSCENFVVKIAGRLVVNEILGSCSVATSGRHFDGTYATSGGLVAVTQSTGVSWTFVEER
jgi:hypothetical protein